MITAVDTSVLVDFFANDRRFGRASQAALQRCATEGALVACAVVWAEVACSFSRPQDGAAAMTGLSVGYDALDLEVALSAAGAWQQYRRAGGTRRRILPDFLIGGHAMARADRLLTRDRGFYRSHFSRLTILEP